jgi:hypothetical protein
MRLAREGMAFVINRLQRGRILLHSFAITREHEEHCRLLD